MNYNRSLELLTQPDLTITVRQDGVINSLIVWIQKFKEKSCTTTLFTTELLKILLQVQCNLDYSPSNFHCLLRCVIWLIYTVYNALAFIVKMNKNEPEATFGSRNVGAESDRQPADRGAAHQSISWGHGAAKQSLIQSASAGNGCRSLPSMNIKL